MLFNYSFQVSGNMGALPSPLFIIGLTSWLQLFMLKAVPYIQCLLIQIGVASQPAPHCKKIKLTHWKLATMLCWTEVGLSCLLSPLLPNR